MLRRLILGGLGAALLLAVFAAAAEASPPYITHGKNVPTGVYEDPAWSEACGFPVYVNGTDHYTERKYPTKTVVVDKLRGVIYEEGHAPLALSEDATITEDLLTGDQTWHGVAQSIADGGGKPIAKDVGDITFDEEGNIVSEHGPHPIANGTAQPAVCDALNS